jgi:hypothetical protein
MPTVEEAKAILEEAKRSEKEKARAEKAREKAKKKAELDAAIEEASKQHPNVDNWFNRRLYLAPEFENAKFGEADINAFRRIKYSFNPCDHSVMILVRTDKSSWAAVVLDKRAPQELARVCAQAAPDDNRYNSLYDEIEAATTGMLNELFHRYGQSNSSNANQDTLVATVVKKVPGLMLKNYSIGILYSKEEYKLSNNPEDERSRQFSRPHAAWFCTGELSARRDAFDHLCENADQMLKHAEMVMPMPKLFSNNPEEPALHHVDLNSLLDYDSPHPTWDIFFERFVPEEAKVLRAFLYGIFDAENVSRQLLYIYDKDGFSGKSVLINAIRKFLGEALVASIQKDSLINQFSLAKVYDKRLVTISDTKNPNLVRSEKMHMMLGGDAADVERKGRDSFTYRLQMKVIASGNVRLNIDPDATHERTRVIVITPKITDKILKEVALLNERGEVVRTKYGRPQLMGDPEFEKKLVAEFRSMMVQAKEDYEELCPRRGNYILPESVLDEIETSSADELDILDTVICERFEFGPTYNITPLDLTNEYDFSVPDSVKEVVKYNDFLAHLAKKYNVTKRTVRSESGTYPKMYVGMRLKEALK